MTAVLDYHIPVLLQHSVQLLVHSHSGVYVDCTFGGGGHSRAVLQQLDAHGRLIALDQDPDAQQNALSDARFTLVPQNFRHLAAALQQLGIARVDGILADLGVSSHQFDTASRGFSYRADAALDMRMDTTGQLTAADVVNEYDEAALADVLYQYGELHQSRRLARAIVAARSVQAIATTGQLVSALQPLLPRQGAHSVLAQLFQALRIEVNDELGALKALLQQSLLVLAPGGRLVVISYHSLEDRLVKHFMASGNLSGVLEKDFYGNTRTPFVALTRKAVQPNAEEIALNPRARSARLRAAATHHTPHT